jgi:hypothetical protein
VRAVDYLRVRADGRVDRDIRATIETNDGHRIGLSADGVGTPRPGEAIADLCENVHLITAAAGYRRVHTRHTWGLEPAGIRGTIVKVHTKDVNYKGYFHHASRDEPQYDIKSDKTDHVALHKAGALRHLRR